MKDDFWKNFPPIPGFDCVGMKNNIQQRIYEETKNMSPRELVVYFKKRAESRAGMAVCETAPEYKTETNGTEPL